MFEVVVRVLFVSVVHVDIGNEVVVSPLTDFVGVEEVEVCEESLGERAEEFWGPTE